MSEPRPLAKFLSVDASEADGNSEDLTSEILRTHAHIASENAGKVCRTQVEPAHAVSHNPGVELRKPTLDRQLVVARYREDLTWLSRADMPVIVYCKDSACEDSSHVHLPNRQREAGTMLHHIVDHYDDLACLTYFAQGNPFEHARDFLKRLKVIYKSPTSLTTQYLRQHPSPEVKAKDKVETVQGFMVRYGDATIDDHSGSSSSRWYNPATWPYLFDCVQPKPLWFGYGAMWAVPREAIHRRPLTLWRHLLEVCDSGFNNPGTIWTDPPINPWMMEASWYYLFQDPWLYPHHRKWDETVSLIRAEASKKSENE